MKWFSSRFLWGGLLIVFGALVLLENLGFMTLSGITAALLIAFGGLFFFSLYFQDRNHYWPLIPGFTLISVAGVVILSQVSPKASEGWSGLIILGGIGLSFLVIFLLDRKQWWALIPAGVMITLAFVSALDEFYRMDAGGIFFLGLALTFALVALVPVPEGDNKWAWIPAGILGLIGVVIISSFNQWAKNLWPLLLVLVGIYIIVRNVWQKK